MATVPLTDECVIVRGEYIDNLVTAGVCRRCQAQKTPVGILYHTEYICESCIFAIDQAALMTERAAKIKDYFHTVMQTLTDVRPGSLGQCASCWRRKQIAYTSQEGLLFCEDCVKLYQ